MGTIPRTGFQVSPLYRELYRQRRPSRWWRPLPTRSPLPPCSRRPLCLETSRQQLSLSCPLWQRTGHLFSVLACRLWAQGQDFLGILLVVVGSAWFFLALELQMVRGRLRPVGWVDVVGDSLVIPLQLRISSVLLDTVMRQLQIVPAMVLPGLISLQIEAVLLGACGSYVFHANREFGFSTPCPRVLYTSWGQHGRRCLFFSSSESEAVNSLLTVANDDSGILSVIPIAQLFSATTFESQCLTEDGDMIDSSDGRRHSDAKMRTWDQKLSSGLLLTFMSTHFRFAETEQYCFVRAMLRRHCAIADPSFTAVSRQSPTSALTL